MSISREIDAKINIVDLVGRYVQMKKSGANYKASCPFHSEKTPSFMISPAKNIAYCFSCHKWGGPIKFLSEIEKIEFREAVQMLAKEAGVELKTDYYKERGENRTDVYDLYKFVATAYHEELFHPDNADKLAYVTRRWLSIETIRTFQIGYSGDPRTLYAKLIAQGFADKDIMDSGVFVSAHRDKFFGRIIFPIANFTGNIVAFTGRIIDQGEPKYLNSPASRIFNKSEILYGLHLAKSTISKTDRVIIVEGQMDTVTLHQAGYIAVVGISGTALTTEHIGYLKRLSRKIYLCLDSDKAGVNATFSSLENLLNEEVDIKIIHITDGKDPDEFIKSGGDFEECIKTAISPVQFFVDHGRAKYDIDSVVGKTQILRDVLKYVRRMTNRIEIDMSIKILARALDLSENIIYDELKNIKLPRITEEAPKLEWPTLGDVIAGYASAYGLFDLFLERIAYTEPHFDAIPGALFLKSCLDSSVSGTEIPDFDRLKALELEIEESHPGAQRESILPIFHGLIKKAQKLMFEHEKSNLENQFDPNSTEYFIAYSSLLKKGKELGII